jgi:tRNA(Arg) A34 adenosine deaminase TadA
MDDLAAMAIALEEARAALGHGDVPIGAVVVVDGEVVVDLELTASTDLGDHATGTATITLPV